MTEPAEPTLDTAVASWIDEDPDPATAAELTALLKAHRRGDAQATAALVKAFTLPLAFGPAGLRGRTGPGPGRLNRAVAIRTAAGLSAYLRSGLGDGFRVVVGYDAHPLSRRLARDTAAVVTGAGGRALLFAEHCPAPVLAFALRYLGADAAVMVTTSASPPQGTRDEAEHRVGHETGQKTGHWASDEAEPDAEHEAELGARHEAEYRVYLGERVVTGPGQDARVAPPYDARVAAAIEAVGPLGSVPMPQEGWTTVDPRVHAEYVERAAQAAHMGAVAPLRVVLTPLHGVGGPMCREALTRVGLDDVIEVTEQWEPVPGAPAPGSPSLEDPHSLDLATALARERGADLVIALDPDAGRCGVAVPDALAPTGWRRLSGDEVGALLGEQAAELAAFTGNGVLASSVVSSRLLRRIAQTHGLTHQQTLSGFAWICQVPDLVYGYEEALGYCADPAAVRDRDGISAAVRMVVLASVLKQQGRSVTDLLDRLAREHGLHATSRLDMRVAEPRAVAQVLERLRRSGPPARLAGSAVARVIDLKDGKSDGAGGWLPPSDGLVWLTAADDRVVLHPSGSEPVLRCYCEVVMPVGKDSVPGTRKAATARLGLIKDDLRAVLGLG